MQADTGGFRGDERGVSEVIAFGLIVGMAVLGSVLVVVLSGGMVDDAVEQTERESAELLLSEMDAKLTTLANEDDVGRVAFDLDGQTPGGLATDHRSSIKVTVNRNASATGPDCQVDVPVSTVAYEDSDGTTVAYEAGGIWRGDRHNGSAMVSPPDLRFRNGSLRLTGVAIDGTVGESTTQADLDVGDSRTDTSEARERLLSGDCIRPDNLTIKVTSRFYRGWENHLSAEFGDAAARVEAFEDNGTVLVHVPQDGLPRSVDDHRNRVVNLSGASYMTVATVEDNPPGDAPAYINISKEDPSGPSRSTRYKVRMRPIGNSSFQLGNETTVTDVTSSPDVAQDVVFVLDDSRSMSCDGYSSGDPPCTYLSTYGEDKIDSVKTASKGAMPALNASDRVGIAAYNGTAWYPGQGSHAYLTNNHDAVNGSIDRLTAGGYTCIYCGLRAGLRAYSANGDQMRNRTITLLTDGSNTVSGDPSADAETRAVAHEAADRGITIHTVAFGVNADETLLEDVADITGGEFKDTRDPDELKDFFRDSVLQTVSEDRIRLTALSTNATVQGGGPRPPYLTGDADAVDRVTVGGSEYPNVNDPVAPSRFRHAFAVEDGQRVNLSASWYGCDEWRVLPVERNGRQVSRCASFDTDAMHNVTGDDTEIYLDGDPAPPVRSTPAWQEDIDDRLDPVLDGGAFDLRSNQAVVVYDFGFGTGAEDNRMAVLYEVGLAEGEVHPDTVLDVRVRNVTFD